MPQPAARRFAAGLLALAFAGTAAADARGDLHAAFLKNMAAKTYRATMTDLAGKPFSTVEFQAPDRYRMHMAATGQTTVIADGKMHMHAGGRVLAVPMPKGTLENMRSDAAWKRMEAHTVITDAGLGRVSAEPARKYHWVSSGKEASAGDTWVSLKSGYVVQVETAPARGSKAGGVRIRYSDFNSPAIRVVPPK